LVRKGSEWWGAAGEEGYGFRKEVIKMASYTNFAGGFPTFPYREYPEARWLMRQDKPRKKIMTKVTHLAKRLLDADTRTFIKAGFIDSDLELTESGKEFLLTKYLAENKKELAKEAKEYIKEREKEDDDYDDDNC
jgi:hypothetical protein